MNDIVPGVDWTTTGNAVERRKRQNRLNQRVQRQRRRALAARSQIPATTGDHAEEALLAQLASLQCFANLQILGPQAPSSIKHLFLLEATARTAYAKRSPRTDILLGLTQLNVRRALLANIEVLGLTASEMDGDALSPFSISGTWRPEQAKDQLPVALRPTMVQRSVPHHPWLDLLPDAAFRNNLILLDAAGLLDEEQLCRDMCGRYGVIVWKDP
ncbi:hypothetical protein ST47_g8448 [Ascochyta rabiei]|uniref:Uncharacterized protein n=1 Tax=Didymella rabiei TaxID=5454 RepID=A0A162YYX5_DIDRA|nr:hypothetical protein ST47_g8448 [Ascochyta rabiei]